MPYTRSQVANKIGRSISTVREMERIGSLRPSGEVGHRRFFDADHVDRIAEHIGRTGRALDIRHAEGVTPMDREPVAALRAELREAREQVSKLTARVRTANDERECLRDELVSAIDALILAAPSRNARMAVALERIVALLS